FVLRLRANISAMMCCVTISIVRFINATFDSFNEHFELRTKSALTSVTVTPECAHTSSCTHDHIAHATCVPCMHNHRTHLFLCTIHMCNHICMQCAKFASACAHA